MPTRPVPTRRPPEQRGSGRRHARHVALPDRHLLYTPAVQSVEGDLDLFASIYRRLRRQPASHLREDFCGTAALACAWAARGGSYRAWGVDQDGPTLAWARRRRLPSLGAAAARVTLVQADVCRVTLPRVDLILALNFSYWVFQRRAELGAYFRAARRSLRRGGMLILDAFGGTDALQALVERRRVPASRGPDGGRVPSFVYVWEQEDFDPVSHRLRSHIHFRLRDGREVRRAFSYDWRVWTLPEIRELLVEAGFREARVYLQDWDDRNHEPLATYSHRRHFENQLSWLAYVVGVA
jgi:SAM-dependent methyltransferase